MFVVCSAWLLAQTKCIAYIITKTLRPEDLYRDDAPRDFDQAVAVPHTSPKAGRGRKKRQLFDCIGRFPFHFSSLF